MVGIFGLAFQIFITKAFKLSDISEITPFIFTGVILSALSDWLVWSNAPSGRFWVGAAVIVLSVSLLAKLKARNKPPPCRDSVSAPGQGITSA